jgi:hypothetical protein
MKEISFTLDQNKSISQYILSKGLSFQTKYEDPYNLSSAKTNSKHSQKENNGSSNFLSNFWNRLISKPESFSQHPSTEISKILEEEKGVSASKMINTVLSQKLNLDINSAELLDAAKKSNQIFHEDFPGDYILEYMGDRLGLFLWDISYDSNGKANVEYKFRPKIKSFKGLF